MGRPPASTWAAVKATGIVCQLTQRPIGVITAASALTLGSCSHFPRWTDDPAAAPPFCLSQTRRGAASLLHRSIIDPAGLSPRAHQASAESHTLTGLVGMPVEPSH
jgi:hypothetical protein